MKIIFHIGMGKTGTTSIQTALRQNELKLREAKAYYLGLWFDLLGEQYSGLSGTSRFLSSSDDEMKINAENFINELNKLEQHEGASTFILSNESLFQNTIKFSRFLTALRNRDSVDVKVISYIRNPSEWIVSAYSQWGINHKTVAGRIPPIGDMAPSLLSQYDAARYWISDFQGKSIVRDYSATTDVVTDFGHCIGIDLVPPLNKALERKELAELILRRNFNNSFNTEVLPSAFDEVVWGGRSKPEVESIESIISSMFDQSSVDTAIDEKDTLWAEVKEATGIDLSRKSRPLSIPDQDATRDRILEHLLVLVMRQSKRIHSLELKLKDFRESKGA